MLSTDSQFCALNLYQLAIMATLSYNPFGQEPEKTPIREKTVSFPLKPSMGNWFGDALAKFDEVWRADPGQGRAYYPLYEDVAYSRRLEIVPFDPDLYPANNPELEEDQETPTKIHFLDDRADIDDTDTQAFITHNDELILISVRGTSEIVADGLRDADAFQVPFEEGVGKVHRGFYQAAQKVYDFAVRYLDKFYIGQKLIICGHSLGGAVTLLLAEMLRRQKTYEVDMVLYTYGAPRAADRTFVNAAAELVHYRIVNHNDPVPSVPGTWMNTKASAYGSGLVLTFFNVMAGISMFIAGIINVEGEPYEHHGKLRHFLPVIFGEKEMSSILWEPGCEAITQHAACTLALQKINGLPDRPGLMTQLFNAANHTMVDGYVPCCWVTLRRWQEAHESKRSLVTEREFNWIDGSLAQMIPQLRAKNMELLRGSPRYLAYNHLARSSISREIDNVRTTRDRLATLRYEKVTEMGLYGQAATQADFADNLRRWQAHPENQVAEQWAMAPAADSDDDLIASILLGRAPGTPCTIDDDDIDAFARRV